MKLRDRILKLLHENCCTRDGAATTYPAAWNVKMLRPITFEQVLARIVKDNGYHCVADVLVTLGVDVERLRSEFNRPYVHEHALNEMRTGILETDTYHCCTPERYAQWGLPGYAKDAPMWSVEYEFHGRSGGWLVMTQFRGVPIHGNIDDVLDHFERPGLKALGCMIDEVSHAVEQRYDEYEYLVAMQVHALLGEP